MSCPPRLSASAGDWLRLVLERILQQSPLNVLDWLIEACNVFRYLWDKTRYHGTYEVLKYEAILELKDRGGKRATFKKHEKVRYLQNNAIAYQDQAWGMERS
jgi:hypothetical protein